MQHLSAIPARAGVRPRPVLMIPLRRCGSHALRLRLNFNPQFHSPYPLHIVDFMPLVPLYGDLQDDRAYFRLVVDVVGLQAASMVKWDGPAFDPVEIFECIRHQPRSVHRVVWELLLRAGEHAQAGVVMDKSLDSVHYAEELMSLFPDMLFLNVVRDPRAQVASMNRAIIHDFDTELNARTWLAAHRAADAVLARYPERTLTIRYEDFLADQEGTLKTICAFFGIEFLPQMLDISKSGEARRISQLSALWASNCFAPIAAHADKFLRELDAGEIAVIETLCAEHMQRYGYQRLSTTDIALEATAGAAAHARSEAGRSMAWQRIEQENFRDFALRRHRADYLATVRSRLERRDAGLSAGAPVQLEELDRAAFETAD